jgi:Ala-tRNA(Pro) deacylase
MKLEPFLQQQGIRYERHVHPTAYTAQELAHEEHVTGYMVAKPVVVRAGSGFVMCVVPAPKQLDLKKAADALGEHEVRLATESEMGKLFADCELGAEPPVGSLFNLRTMMDAGLKQDQDLVMQAGTHTEAVKLRREDWEKVCAPTVAPIAAGPDG